MNKKRNRRSVHDDFGRLLSFSFWTLFTFIVLLASTLYLDTFHNAFPIFDRLAKEAVAREWKAERDRAHWRWMRERQRDGLNPFHGPPTPLENE